MATVEINEKASALYTATLKDENGVVISLGNITTATMTLFDVETGTIINSRNAQDIKNANNVTIHATSGLLTWSLQPADTIIVDSTRPGEEHRAEITVVYNSRVNKHEVVMYIRNLTKTS